MKLEGLEAFVATVEEGTVSAAARRLGLSKSALSDRLSELERSVGAHLLQRTTRKLALTSAGESFLLRSRRILQEAADAKSEITERRGALSGPLRISAPVSFGTLHLGKALYPLLAAHPAIELTLDLDDRFVDVAGDGYDVVIRHGPVRDARLIAKRVAKSRRHLVASPAYLRKAGRPGSVADLQAHRGIVYLHREPDWRFKTAKGVVVARPERCLRLNNGLIMRDAAVAGLGIALLPSFLVQPELASGKLTSIDLGATPEGADIFVAYPTARGATAKVAALLAAMRRAFGSPPYWEVKD
jgi:DNA-binding transcriptional LysR family regulator